MVLVVVFSLFCFLLNDQSLFLAITSEDAIAEPAQ